MKTKLWMLFLLPLCLMGCGYRLGNMTVGGIQTLGIRAIDNQTGKTFIEESLVTNALVREFNRDGSVKIVQSEVADALLLVTLIDYNQRAEIFTSQDIGEQFRLIINAKIQITSPAGEEVLLNTHIQGEAAYETDLDQSEIERTATQTAITDMAIDIVRSTVEGGW